jgi:hypothetical protein
MDGRVKPGDDARVNASEDWYDVRPMRRSETRDSAVRAAAILVTKV